MFLSSVVAHLEVPLPIFNYYIFKVVRILLWTVNPRADRNMKFIYKRNMWVEIWTIFSFYGEKNSLRVQDDLRLLGFYEVSSSASEKTFLSDVDRSFIFCLITSMGFQQGRLYDSSHLTKAC